MRMISAIQPTPIPDLTDLNLDRLEIMPCGVVESDTACLLVRYFNFEQDDVEGDNFFETIDEALEYAKEVYGVSISEWRIDTIEQTSLDAQEMYKSILMEHFHMLKAREIGRFFN